MNKPTISLFICALTGALLLAPAVNAATVIGVDEDVMVSPFFTGANLVRGYFGEGRNVHRVSTDDPFGTVGAETIYLTFDFDFAGTFSGPVVATLNVQSVAGGFGADAGPANPFTVSAHAVNANPLSTIIDDTNPGGATDWITYYNTNILAPDIAAATVVDGVGTVEFDVSGIVNDWISGSNSVFAIALTGMLDTSGADFLHGFQNDSQAPGSTFLSVSAVPLPGAAILLAPAVLGLAGYQRQRQQRAGP